MASVTLAAIFLNIVADPSDSLKLIYAGDFSRSHSRPGEVRRGAGGRTRVFMRAGREVSWEIPAVSIDRAQIRWLEDRMGQLLCARDLRGNKIFGTYMAVPFTEYPHRDEADATLTFSELSFSEAV